MNALCYKIVFSKRLGTLVAVGEHTAGQGKATGTGVRTAVFPSSSAASADNFVGLLKAVFASVALSFVTVGVATAAGPAANTLPTGYSVNSGNVAISSSATANNATMVIKQNTDKASINWQSFSIGSGAAVNVQQNSANSVLLNRVVGNDPSQIFGKLTANGQVILINPNGVVFGKGGSVTASAFTASTFGMTDADFQAGKHQFSRNGSTAGVTVEQGATINTTAPGGYVALLGASVNNQGEIHTHQGAVVMAAGESVALPTALTESVGVPLSNKVRLELAPSTLMNASVENGGTITTEGGQVLMQAAAVADAVASVTHTGAIDTTGAQGGAVTLQADHGIVKATGTIKANSTAGKKGGDIIIGRDEVTGILARATNVSGAKLESKGGFVETSGEWLATTGTRVLAKDWLLDPTDITITSGTTTSPSWTTPQSSSSILAEDIAFNLNAGTNVTIQTSASGTQEGKISVDAPIVKNTTTSTTPTLKLDAAGRILVNKDIKVRTQAGNNLNVEMKTTNGGIVIGDGVTLDMNRGNLTMTANILSTGSQSTIGVTMGDLALAKTATIRANNFTMTINNANSSASSYGAFLGCTGCTPSTNGLDIQVNNFTINNNTANGTGVVLGRDFRLTASDTASITSSSKYDAIWAPVGKFQAKTITMSGTSTAGVGVAIYPWATVTATSGGGITITGTAGSNTLDGIQLYGNIINNGSVDTSITSTKGNVNFDTNGKITNASSAGAIIVVAQDGSIKYGTNWTNPITQNSNNGVTLKAKGDVWVPKIANNGTGDVVIVAGNGMAAGEVTGGQVKTKSGNTITNNNGNTRIYSGNLVDTGTLSNLGLFNDLWLEGNNQNIVMNTASNGTSKVNDTNSSTTAKHQVMFREGGSFNFGNSLKGATYTGTYGDANTKVGQEAALWTSVKDQLKQNNATNTLSATLSSTNTGSNVVKISAATVIDTLSGTLGANSPADYSSSRYLKANSNGYSYNNVSSSQYNVGFANEEVVKAVVNKVNATVTANSDTKTYNGQTQAVTGFSATGLVGGETASVLTGVTTRGGSGKNAGTYTHVASGSDSNYNLTFVDGKLDISKANAIVTANSGTKTYNGQTQAVTGFTATGLVAGETESVLTGVTTAGGTGKDAGTYTHTAKGTDANYNLQFTSGALTIVKNSQPVVPPTPGPIPYVKPVKPVVTPSNPFQLASAEDLADDVCSANSLENCYCEESPLNKGVDICYEPKTAGKGSVR